MSPDPTASYAVGTFCVDATPPIGSPVAYAPARSITDPLSARGIVILGTDAPIVLCVLDWLGLGRSARDTWRAALAEAAATTIDRVAVQTVHQHDAPRWDRDAEELLGAHGLGGQWFDTDFATTVVQRCAEAVRAAVDEAQPCTHVGFATARVDRIASNRRVLGPDGRVLHQRMSSCTDPEAAAAPEGEIDPELTMISLWHDDRPIAVLSSYACHPQSHYGQGDVTAEWVGIARQQREDELGIPHIHLTGAAGDVAAGKYNDGTPPRRAELAGRLADAMTRAWHVTTREPLTEVGWRSVPTALPLARWLDRDALRENLVNPDAHRTARIRAATKLCLLASSDPQAHTAPVDITALGLNAVRLLLLPGEPFVAYQLHARASRTEPVMVAGYGDYSFGYIGTRIAYQQGGYETTEPASNVSPEVEDVLIGAIDRALR